jgi:hypothetical protein
LLVANTLALATKTSENLFIGRSFGDDVSPG